jgi:2-keto-3-deoxy-L-rhamnonate aldolase RhmA
MNDELQAVASYPAHPVVRTVDGDPAAIKQLLDSGVQTLLVPMVDTPEQAPRWPLPRAIRKAWLRSLWR